ncbi:MAG TPA: DUF4340 domain-containing protein [Verrucomicrobiae bacterium]|nr:DUF4340 domain-containing protein [Verrucomicrobiae bacterium]
MNKNQLTILIVLVAAVGLGGWMLYKKQEASWAGGTSSKASLLSDLPVGESLAQVVIRQGTNEVNLVKQSETWRVKERGNYPANYAQLSSAILKLRDLKPVQTEPIGASQRARLELLPPGGAGTNGTGTAVEFRDAKGKLLNSLLLGKSQMRQSGEEDQFGAAGGIPIGRWLMVGDAKDIAVLVSDPLSNLTPAPASWLDKDFLKVEKIKAISVTHTVATNSWSVSRTNETGTDWVLADAKPEEKLDSSKTSGFSWALSSPTFNDVLVAPKPEAVGLDHPTTIQLETFDGFHYTLKVGNKTNDDEVLTVGVEGTFPRTRTPGKDEKAEDKTKLDKEFADNLKKLDDKLGKEKAFEGWTYLVPSYTLDSLIKNRSELLVEKKDEKGATNEVSTATAESSADGK